MREHITERELREGIQRELRRQIFLESERQERYQEFFRDMMDRFGVSSPAELSDEEKEDFFNSVALMWDEEKGEPNRDMADLTEKKRDRLSRMVNSRTRRGVSKDEAIRQVKEKLEGIL
jgi:hypothetical protein